MRKLTVVVLCLVVAGCGSQPQTTLEQADELFTQGQFDEAIRLIDDSLPTVKFLEDKVALLTLKGRCYWEKTATAKSPQEVRQQLDLSLAALTASIESMDTAEARHLRSMVHEKLGQRKLADTDQAEWRRLDEAYRSAYLSEPPEEILLDLEPRGSNEANDESSAETAAAEKQPWQPPRDNRDNEDSTPPSLATSPAAPPSQPSGGSGRPTTGSTGRSRDQLAESNAGRAGADGATARNNRLAAPPPTDPLAEDFASDTESEAPEKSAADPDRDESSADGESNEPAGPRLPGSTWQPWYPQDPATGDLGMAESTLGPAAGGPTTGIIGPLVGPATDPTATTTPSSPWSDGATTGITGPPGSPAGDGAHSGGSSVPTTGIGAAPIRTLPSGFPSEWGPAGFGQVGPVLTHTGALPAALQPKVPASPLSNLPLTGPYYSPLRPSPLTVPGAGLNNRLPGAAPAPGGVGVGTVPRPSAGAAPASRPAATAPGVYRPPTSPNSQPRNP